MENPIIVVQDACRLTAVVEQAHQLSGLKAEYIRRYGDAYMLDSPHSRELMGLFHRRCQSAGILHDNDLVFQYLSQFEEKTMPQMSLF